jgi:hypothetical protein
MVRLLLRVLLSLLLFFVARLLRPRAPRQGGAPGEGSRPSPRPPGSVPPIDRSDVVDVPFTEIPPPTDSARGAAGRP